MQEWKQGDRIYMFGFSRGSYEARCVAGMVQKIGLLPQENIQMLTFAYELYSRVDPEGVKLASSFKRSFARDVKIDFVGMFDTVSSVGLILNRELPYTSLNEGIKVFRHALALDERRLRFLYSPWSGPIAYPWTDFLTSPPIPIPAILTNFVSRLSWNIQHPASAFFALQNWLTNRRPTTEQVLSAGKPAAAAQKLSGAPTRDAAPSSSVHTSANTDVKEVWFTGCHEDIGGGAVSDSTAVSLSDITLRWMVLELLSIDAPIIWNSLELLSNAGANLEDSLSALDDRDALAPIHDRLTDIQAPMWWLVEFVPLGWAWEDKNGDWFRQIRINLGRGRRIEGTPMVHYTVKKRMEDSKLHYNPRANIGENPHWVYPKTDEITSKTSPRVRKE